MYTKRPTYIVKEANFTCIFPTVKREKPIQLLHYLYPPPRPPNNKSPPLLAATPPPTKECSLWAIRNLSRRAGEILRPTWSGQAGDEAQNSPACSVPASAADSCHSSHPEWTSHHPAVLSGLSVPQAQGAAPFLL